MRRGISLILSTILCLTFLVGCGGGVDNSPKGVVTEYLEKVKTGDSSGLNTLLSVQLEEELGEDLTSDENVESDMDSEMADMLKEVQYKIMSENIEGDTAKVEVSINNYNFTNIFVGFLYNYMSEVINTSFSGEEFSDEDADKLANDILEKEFKEAKQETRVEILTLKKENDIWKIEQDEAFVKLMIGESTY